ncbi:MAG: hypothetical protein K0R73_836 [Candidatus Midichloriaceae bacterium]|jgi:hypothetical protein|nr:hypothetical protein [Candidatus Midichloriaceae bacterium]
MLAGPAAKFLLQSTASKYAMSAFINPGYYGAIFSSVTQAIPTSTIGHGVFNAVSVAATSLGGPAGLIGIVAVAALTSTAIYFYINRDKEKFDKNDWLKIAGWTLLSAVTFITLGTVSRQLVNYYFPGSSEDSQGKDIKTIVAEGMEAAKGVVTEVAEDALIGGVSEATGVPKENVATFYKVAMDTKAATALTAIGAGASALQKVTEVVYSAATSEPAKAAGSMVIEGAKTVGGAALEGTKVAGSAGVNLVKAGAEFVHEHPQEVAIGLAVTAVLGTAAYYREDIAKGVNDAVQDITDTANEIVDGVKSSVVVSKNYFEREMMMTRPIKIEAVPVAIQNKEKVIKEIFLNLDKNLKELEEQHMQGRTKE